MTRLGWGAAALGIVALAAGILTGWVEAIALGSALLAALAVALVQSWGSSSYDVQVDLASRRVTHGERVVGRLRIRSTARRRLLPALLELPVAGSVTTLRLPGLAPGAEVEEVFRIPTSRRAVVPVGPAATVRSDPLGLISRRRSWTGISEIVVHPRTVSLGTGVSGLVRDLEGRSTPSVAEASLEFHALREYVPGDDVRRIHWPSTARLGDVVVRMDEDVRRTRTVVVLVDRAQEYASEEEFELAVSVAASWGVHAIRERREVRVRIGTDLPVGSPVSLLDATAAVATSSEGADVAQSAQWVSRTVPDASLVVLVTGSVTDDVVLRRALRVLPVDAVSLVLACAPGRDVEVSGRDGATLARVGELLDVQRIVRSVLR